MKEKMYKCKDYKYMECNHCNFIAKSKGGLTLHKKKHVQSQEKYEEKSQKVNETDQIELDPPFHHIPIPKRFIDLCCGIGGFHQALSSLGYSCVFASDIDKHCQDTYEQNYGIRPKGDFTEIDIASIPPFDILCAGFPCQPFSRAGKQLGFEDERGNLFFSICRIIQYHKPSYLLLENVRNLVSHDDGNTWKVIRTTLQQIGYTTYDTPLIVNAMDVGIPQHRERVIILCQRADLGPLRDKPVFTIPCQPLSDFLEKNIIATIPKKVQEVESVWNEFLAILLLYNISIPKFPLWTDWWDNEFTEDDPFFLKYTNWITKNREWFTTHQAVLSPWLIKSRLNEHWIGAVRKLEWQAGTLLPTDSMRTVLWSFRGSGIRVKRPDYVPTIVAMNMTPIYGPERRYLTARELLRLQSFPDTFQFDLKYIHKQVGNAVNVKVIRQCAAFLLQ